MLYSPRVSRLYVAIDESNHGKEEEVFVGAFSSFPGFARRFRTTGNFKGRREIASHIRCGNYLDYRFCIVNRDDYSRFGVHNVHQEVARAFYNAFSGFQKIDSTTLYLDGGFSGRRRGFVQQAIKKVLRVPRAAVSVLHAPKTKDENREIETNILLMFADYSANFLFRAPAYELEDKRGIYYAKRVPFPLNP